MIRESSTAVPRDAELVEKISLILSVNKRRYVLVATYRRTDACNTKHRDLVLRDVARARARARSLTVRAHCSSISSISFHRIGEKGLTTSRARQVDPSDDFLASRPRRYFHRRCGYFWWLPLPSLRLVTPRNRTSGTRGIVRWWTIPFSTTFSYLSHRCRRS